MPQSTRICVAVRESTTAAAREAAARAARWADLVEIRADFIRDLDLGELLRDKPCPILFTLRAPDQGGAYTGPERARLESIVEAAHLGADYVDVELSAYWRAILEAVPRERVVVSHHDFERTPPLEPLLEELAATGAGIVKLATRASGLADNVRVARMLRQAADRGLPAIGLAMGRPGMPTRVLAGLWGSWLTFASLPGGEATADGQVPADILLESYRIRQIGPETRCYGVVGRPLGHSLSPLVHNAMFAAAGRDAVFLPLEASSAEDLWEFEALCRLEGLSITIPYKEQMLARAGSLSVAASATGAINTLARSERGWHGENTDVDGFLRPLVRRLTLSRRRAVVLGAGGAARAAVYALQSQGATVAVAARSPEKGRVLADELRCETIPWGEVASRLWDLLVNATPVGMRPDVEASPVPDEWLRPGAWVYDLVYNPAETRLLRAARARGCTPLGGAEMFLAQAMRQQQVWFGAPPDEEVMRRVLDEALQARDAAAAAAGDGHGR